MFLDKLHLGAATLTIFWKCTFSHMNRSNFGPHHRTLVKFSKTLTKTRKFLKVIVGYIELSLTVICNYFLSGVGLGSLLHGDVLRCNNNICCVNKKCEAFSLYGLFRVMEKWGGWGEMKNQSVTQKIRQFFQILPMNSRFCQFTGIVF